MPVDFLQTGIMLTVSTGYFFLRYENSTGAYFVLYAVNPNRLARLCNLSVVKMLRNGVEWCSALLKKFLKSSVSE